MPPQRPHMTYETVHQLLLNRRQKSVVAGSGEKMGWLEQLLEADQLNMQRAAGHVFTGFCEAPVTFPPTYKFIPGTPHYDRRPDKKKRAPAWCDRVLWRLCRRAASLGTVAINVNSSGGDSSKNGSVTPLFYGSVASSCKSDHLPVAFVSTLAVSCFDASTFTEVCKARIIPVNQRQQEQKQEQRLRAPRVTFRPPALGSIIEKLPRELLSPTSDEAGGGSGRDDRCQAQQPYEST